MYWGYTQRLSQEYPLPDIGTLPPHNLGNVYWLVASNTHTHMQESFDVRISIGLFIAFVLL